MGSTCVDFRRSFRPFPGRALGFGFRCASFLRRSPGFWCEMLSSRRFRRSSILGQARSGSPAPRAELSSLGSPAGCFAAAQRLLLCRSSCQPTLRPPSASRGRTRVRWGVCSANVHAGLIFKPLARTVGLSPRPSPPPSRRGVALSWNQANGRSRRANSRLAGWMVWECPCGLNFEAPSSDAWAYPRQHAPARNAHSQLTTRGNLPASPFTPPPPQHRASLR